HEPERLATLRSRASAAMVRAEQHNMFAATLGGKAYPAMLETIDDPPPVLWMKTNVDRKETSPESLGQDPHGKFAPTVSVEASQRCDQPAPSTATFNAPAVAIVGSRAASPYAVAVAERFASDLASGGVVIVSGLARGVDQAAHRGALEGGGL